jgi:signal peptidase II
VSQRASGPFIFSSCAAAAAVVDQITKLAIYQRLSGPWEIVPGVLALRPDENTGVVWGLFNRWPLTVFAIGILAVALITFYFLRQPRHNRLESAAWGLIVGGAVGNLIDRALVGHVKDFIVVQFRGWSWPTFNAADAFITVGAILAIWYLSFSKTSQESPA